MLAAGLYANVAGFVPGLGLRTQLAELLEKYRAASV